MTEQSGKRKRGNEMRRAAMIALLGVMTFYAMPVWAFSCSTTTSSTTLNVRSASLNGGSTSLNGHSKTLNEEFNRLQNIIL